MAFLCKDKQRQDSGDHSAVDRKSAFPQVHDLHQVVLVVGPLEENIVDPRSDDGKDNSVKCEIKVNIWILSPALRIGLGNTES